MEEKTTSIKLYIQKYDKELFISKHLLYNPQRQKTLSTFKKTTLKQWNKQLTQSQKNWF
jgi:hypothetical protein